MLYVASHDKLEQLHMQVLLNCHFAAFYSNSKKWPNDNIITLACVIDLIHYNYICSYIAYRKLYSLGCNLISILLLISCCNNYIDYYNIPIYLARI